MALAPGFQPILLAYSTVFALKPLCTEVGIPSISGNSIYFLKRSGPLTGLFQKTTPGALAKFVAAGDKALKMLGLG
jgi:hypothetical protein